MGVPKFYRWISERYPCLSEVVLEYQIPEFDNLYFDMNGIIHLCSHPNDDDPTFRITEEKMFNDISNYIESLFRLIKPRKVFFMAVDGVAPRAKMNQQRGRRFRSAREAIENEEKAVKRGEVLPKEDRFDSNCITPGTEFMAKLNQHLQYLVTKKISSDPSWQGIRVYLSGHNTPGEGEHKIMDFIRHEKSKPGYDTNTRHCLYGLDADLIMLGMCSHDPNFCLLREEVRFTGRKQQKRIPTVENTTFHLLHLSLLRDYLDHEFSVLRPKLSFPYDIEKIIDDWVLMGFLVGNDFIPNLPHLHIINGALSTLIRTYVEVLPTLDGYINESGYLNLSRFEKYMAQLAQVDYDHFDETFTDLKWFELRREDGRAWKSKRVETRRQLEELRAKTNNMFVDDDDSCEDSEDGSEDGLNLMPMEFEQNKRDYYVNKLQLNGMGAQTMAEQAECYVTAIQWTLHYYYNGVCSWSWFYPHHYAPFISDINNFSHLDLQFELGKPFLPFQQLLAVLPAASKQLLPKPYQSLMYAQESPLIDYYPLQFQTDLNGKQQDWEAVVLLPFIDQKRLLEAMAPLSLHLNDEELGRNQHGPCLLYTHSPTPLPPIPSYWPQAFPSLSINHAKCEEVSNFQMGRLLSGTGDKLDAAQCHLGFPRLRFIPHRAGIEKAEVKVFQQNSKGENMILHVEKHRLTELGGGEAMELLGQSAGSVFVAWPHLLEAKVSHVSDAKHKYICRGGQIESLELSKNQENMWRMEAAAIKEKYYKRWGVDVGDIKLIVYANQLVGFKRILSKSDGRAVEEKVYGGQHNPYCVQTIIREEDIRVVPSSRQSGRLTAEQLFLPNTPAFLLNLGDNYGRQATIRRLINRGERGGVSLEVELRAELSSEPQLQPILSAYQAELEDFVVGRVACNRLGISPFMLSRITSTLHISIDHDNRQKMNIGLNMKSAKRSEEMPGFTRKSGNEGWTYSSAAIQAVGDYIQKFPELFEFLNGHPSTSEMLQHEDLIAYCPNIKLTEVESFLRSLPSYSLVCYPCGSEFLSQLLSQRLEEVLSSTTAEDSSAAPKTVNVRPHLLHIPSNVVTVSGEVPPDPARNSFRLLDRVINVKADGPVPLGLKGTVIGIVNGEPQNYEVLFDGAFQGTSSVRGTSAKVYRVFSAHLLNLSSGRNKRRAESELNNGTKPTAVVHPHLATERGSNRGRVGTSKGTVVLNHSPNSPFAPTKPQLYSQPPAPTATNSSNKDSEFQLLWKQLQTQTNKNSRKNHASSATAAASTSGVSSQLNFAAKSLPKIPVPVPLVKAAAPEPAKAQQEFSNLLQALEKQMTPAPMAAAAASTPIAAASKPVYAGQSISLDELFSKPAEQPAKSHVMNLLSLCQQLLRAVPIYIYHLTPDGQYVAQVTLPNALVAHSPPCKTQQEAAEMAALQATNQLTLWSRRDSKIELRPPMVIPPFTMPTYIAAAVSKGPLMYQANPVRTPQPPPPMNQHLIGAPWFLPANRPSLPPPPPQLLKAAPHPQNQFVPLQVTKQSNIGNKMTKGASSSGNAVESKEVEEQKRHQPPMKASKAMTTSSISQSTEDKTPKKRSATKAKKSKLAINFSAAK